MQYASHGGYVYSKRPYNETAFILEGCRYGTADTI